MIRNLCFFLCLQIKTWGTGASKSSSSSWGQDSHTWILCRDKHPPLSKFIQFSMCTAVHYSNLGLFLLFYMWDPKNGLNLSNSSFSVHWAGPSSSCFPEHFRLSWFQQERETLPLLCQFWHSLSFRPEWKPRFMRKTIIWFEITQLSSGFWVASGTVLHKISLLLARRVYNFKKPNKTKSQ